MIILIINHQSQLESTPIYVIKNFDVKSKLHTLQNANKF